MAIGPSVPEVAHETFASPPLKAMFGQIRFPARLQLHDASHLGPFQAAIEHRLPDFAEEEQFSVVIAPGVQPQQSSGKAYRFSASDGSWSVRLSPDSVTLEASQSTEYTSYASFRELYELVWEAVLEHVRPPRLLHQGLRYIDHLEGDRSGQEWAEYINPELLGPITGENLSQGLLRSVSEFRFKRESGLLLFRHGIADAGPENQLGYLLDFDHFTQDLTDDVSTTSVLERFDAFHELIYSLFRWCVTDKALEEFRNDDH